MISQKTLGLILAGSSLFLIKKSQNSSAILLGLGSILFVRGIISERNPDFQAVKEIPFVAGVRG